MVKAGEVEARVLVGAAWAAAAMEVVWTVLAVTVGVARVSVLQVAGVGC